MAENRVTYGLSNVHVAFIESIEDNGVPTWGTPIPILGAIDFTPTPDTSEVRLYADDGIFWATYSDNGYTATLEMVRFPDDFLVEAFGWLRDKVRGVLETNDGIHKNFALMAQVKGNSHGRRIIWYNCAAAKPGDSLHTQEENSEPATQTMDLTISPVNITPKLKGTKYHVDNNADTEGATEVYESFFDSVYIPDFEDATAETLAAKQSNSRRDA